MSATVRRLVVAHAVTTVSEWSVFVGVVVHAFQWGGSSAVGMASVSMLVPSFVLAPVAASLTSRRSPAPLRAGAFAVQALGYGSAALLAAVGSGSPPVIAAAVVGLGAMTMLRPTGAVLLPAIVRSTEELVTVNLRLAQVDSSCALVGSLVAAAVIGLFGPAGVLALAATGAGIATVLTIPIAWSERPLAPGPRSRTRLGMRAIVTDVTARPGCGGVLAVTGGSDLVVGAFDIILVIVALQVLDMGDSGPGLLSALVGAGALAAIAPTAIAVRRKHERSGLIACLASGAALCVVLGVWLDAPVVAVSLPLIGVTTSTVDNLARVILQRATDPRSLGPLFAAMDSVGAAGQLLGSIGAQLLVAVGGVEAALVGLGIAVGVVGLASARSIRRAGAGTEVPVVEMSLLSRLPVFDLLPTPALETVARASRRRVVAAGEPVIEEGAIGDEYYAVSAGSFDVSMHGVAVRSVERGGGFGEVALLAGVPRTATVTASTPGELVTVDRETFLLAVTGHHAANSVAWSQVEALRFDEPISRPLASGDTPP
jgi:hypothetical protein